MCICVYNNQKLLLKMENEDSRDGSRRANGKSPQNGKSQDKDNDESSEVLEQSKFAVIMKEADKAFLKHAESLSMPTYLKDEIYGLDLNFTVSNRPNLYLFEHPYKGTLIRKEKNKDSDSPRLMPSLQSPLTNTSA